jgi:beta-lactam-binding protein with PASTA domain
MIRTLRVASFVLLLMMVGLMAAITTMHFAIHGSEVTVPDFKGMTLEEARQQCAGLSLNLIVDNRYYSAETGVNRVLSQSPTPETVVRQEWDVRVAVSLGPQKVTVPNIVSTQERVATVTLRRYGLDTGTIARIPWAGVTPGTILAQDPQANAQGLEKPAVNMLIAAEPESASNAMVMPNMVGQQAMAAASILGRAGIKLLPPKYVENKIPAVGSGDNAPRAPLLPGVIVAQSVAAGRRVDSSTSVEFTVVK